MYTVIELALEVAFQIEVLSYVAYFTTESGGEFDRIGRGCAITMLLSHWVWFLSSCLKNIQSPCASTQFAAEVVNAKVEENAGRAFSAVQDGVDIISSTTAHGAAIASRANPTKLLKRRSTLSKWRVSIQNAESHAASRRSTAVDHE